MGKKIEQVEQIAIDTERANHAREAYFQWVKLNAYVKNISTRGINMPDVISEQLGCWAMDFLWNRGKAVGDAYDPKTNRKIEFKASSQADGDLTSFGPNSTFDDLVFLHFNVDDNKLDIYDLNVNSDDMRKMPVNQTETFGDQADAGRRPRLSLMNQFDLYNTDPTVSVNLVSGEIETDNR